jgi:hypothetical protein
MWYSNGYMERIMSVPFFAEILALFLAVLCLILIVWVIRIELRLKKLLTGNNGKSLEGVIGSLVTHKEEVSAFKDELETYLESVETRLKRSVQAVETLRFNPFKGDGSGGNLSFSTALMTEEGDGVVLSSLYARDRVSMFAKPVKSHVPEFELTDEERIVLEKAKAVLARIG